MANETPFDNVLNNPIAVSPTSRRMSHIEASQRRVELLGSASERARANQSALDLFDPRVENNYASIIAGLGINSDTSRNLLSGVAGGVGVVLEAVEDAGQYIADTVGAPYSDYRLSDSLYDFSEAASGGVSVSSHHEMNRAQFSGDITDVSSWRMSPDMTLKGVSQNVLYSLGYMAPQFAGRAVSLGSKGIAAVGAAVGGIQAGYGAAEEEEAYLQQFTAEEMYEQFSYTKDLVDNQDITLEEARDLTIRRGKAASGWSNAAYGAASGALLQRVIGNSGKSILDAIPGINQSVVGRAAGITVGSATVEGLQEMGEQMLLIGASNAAIGDNRNIYEDTVNPLIYGALTGGALGAPASVSPAASAVAERAFNEKYGARLGDVIRSEGVNLPKYFQLESPDFDAQTLSREISALNDTDDGNMSRVDLAAAALVAIEQSSPVNQAQVDKYNPENLEQQKETLAKLEKDEADFKKAVGEELYNSTVNDLKEGIAAIEDGSYIRKQRELERKQTQLTEAINILQDIVNTKDNVEATSVDIVTETDGTKVLNHISSFPTHYTADQIYDALRRHEGTIPEVERELMRLIANTSSKINTLDNLSDTASKVIVGDSQWRGINTYRQNISRHIREGNLGAARMELNNLTRFSGVHLSKKEAVSQAALLFEQTGSNIQLVPQGNGAWVVADRVYPPTEAEKAGVLTIYAGSGRLINQISAEADALNAAVHEGTRALELALNKAQAKPKQETAPTTEETVEDAPVDQSEPVQEEVVEQTTEQIESTENIQTDSTDSEISEIVETQPVEQVEVTETTPINQNEPVVEETVTQEDAELASYDDINVPEMDGIGDGTQQEARDRAVPQEDRVGDLVRRQPTEELVEVKNRLETKSKTAPLHTREVDLLQRVEEELTARAERELTQDNVGFEVLEPEVIAAQPEKITESNYRKANLIAKWFRKGRRILPLNTVKDFREVSNVEMVEELLGYKLSLEQLNAFNNFMQNHDKFTAILDKYIGTEYNPEYSYKAPLDYFRIGNGTLDPNVRTALAFAAYMSAYDLAGARTSLTMKEVETMVGKHNYNRADYDKLRNYTMLRSTLIETLGSAAYASLGLRVLKDAPSTQRELLSGSLGLASLAILKESKYITEDTVPITPLKSNQGTKEETKQLALIKVNRDTAGNVHRDLQEIHSAAKNNTSTITELFTGTIDTTKPVFLEDNQTAEGLFNQEVTDLDTEISDKIKEAEQYKAHLEWVPYEPMVEVWNKLDTQAKLTILGRNTKEGMWVHPNIRANVDAQIEATTRDIQNAEELLNDPRTLAGQAFHFVGSIWNNQRSGYLQTSNPQTNKAMRGLVRVKDWTVQVNPNDPAQLRQLELIIAQGFGVNLDNLSEESALDELADKVNLQEVQDALEVLNSDSTTYDSAQNDILATAVGKLGEGMASLDALLTLNQWMNNDGDTPFEVSISVEVDGKTNGPILTLMSLGVTRGDLSNVNYSDAGGYFTNPEIKNYSDYKQGAANPDTYEALARAFAYNLKQVENINPHDRAILDSVLSFTGEVFIEEFSENVEGDITSTIEVTQDGRNMVKQPITMFMFGSSVESAAANAFYETVLPNIFKRITEVHNSNDGENTLAAARTLYKQVSTLLGKKIPVRNMDEFLQYKFSEAEISAMEYNFNQVFGKILSETLKEEFSTFIARRDNINSISNASTDLYIAMYKAEIAALENELSKLEDTPTTKSGRLIFGLSNAQLEEISNRIEEALPSVRTPLADDSHLTGISLLDNIRTSIDARGDSRYESRIITNKAHDTYVNRRRELSGAGVRGVINYIHSLDSAASMAVDRQHVPTLNAHDAKITGLGQLAQTSEALNNAAYNVLLERDISVEAMETLNRVLQHYVDNFEYYQSLGVDATALKEMLKKLEYSELYSALLSKKELLSKVTTMGQYPFPNQLAKIRDKDRANTAEVMDKHIARFLELYTAINGLRADIDAYLPLETLARAGKVNADSLQYVNSAVGMLTTSDVAMLVNILKQNPNLTPNELKMKALLENAELADVLSSIDIPNTVEEVSQAPAIQEMVSNADDTVLPNTKLGKALGTNTVKGHPLYSAIYNAIDKRTSLGKYQVQLLKSLRGILRDSVTLTVNSEPTLTDIRSSVLGQTRISENGQISITLNHIDSEVSGVNPTTAIHELVHAATAVQLELASKGKASPEVMRAYKNLTNMYNVLRERFDVDNTTNLTILNAMQNLDEFVAWAMTDQNFQQMLSEIPTTSELRQPTNMFAALKGFLARLLRLSSPTALDAVINEITVVMEASRTANQQTTTTKTLNRQVGTPASNAQNMSTLEVFDYLGSNTGTSEHTNSVRNVLAKVVDIIYPSVGVNNLNNTYSQDLATLESMYLQSDIVNNNVQHIPFGLTVQESFAAEQIYTTMLGLSRENYTPTNQLREIFLAARDQLKPQDFVDGWDDISSDERLAATEKYDQLFNNTEADQLANFMALALTSEEVKVVLNKVALSTSTLSKAGSQPTVSGKIQGIFEWLLNLFFGSLNGVSKAKNSVEAIESIAWKLGQNEMKYRKRIGQNSESMLVRATAPLDSASQTVRESIATAADSELFNVRYLSSLAKITKLAAEGKIEALVETFQEMMVSTRDSKEGFIGGLLNELTGTSDQNRVHHTLHTGTKQLEVARRQITEAVQKLINNSFANGGRDLTPENRRALLRGLLKTNASTLLREDNLTEVITLLTDTDARNNKIEILKKRIAAIAGNSDVSNTYFYRATTLANYMATGNVIGMGMAMSSQDISTGKGLDFAIPNTQVAQRVRHLIEELVSLESINYLPTDIRSTLVDTINSDSANGYKGIETTLKYHNHTKNLSKQELFDGVDEQSYMTDGYISEMYTENNTLRVANSDAEVARLEELGYVRVSELSKDTVDVKDNKPVLMSIPDGGPVSRVTGSLSTTAKRSTGTEIHGLSPNQLAQRMRDMERAATSGIPLVPNDQNTAINYAVPVYGLTGNVTSMRYVMNERTRDNLLGRDNDFAQALGYTQSRIIDKATSVPQNQVIVEAIKLTWDEGKERHPHAYLRIAANSTDPKLRELWNLLPEETKQAAKQAFGGNFLMVRNDLLNLHFGYRKKSLAAPFQTDEFIAMGRSQALAGLGTTARSIFSDPRQLQSPSDVAQAIYVDLAIALFGDKVGLRLKQGQDLWETLVAEVKDIRVIKNFKTLAANISSNVTVLLIYGAGFQEAIAKHREGALAAVEWESLVSQHLQLTNAIEAGIAPNDRATQAKVRELEQAMDRSPIKPLIEEGLYQAIVSDLEVNVRENQHIAAFKEKLAPYTALIPEQVKTIGKYAFVSKDTGLYKFLHKTTQMSDLVSRYALYYHLIERKDNPMSHKQAAQEAREAFVNYDLPSSEWVQFANDMGGVMFTKYYLRIAKVMARLTGKYPSRMLAGLAFSNYMDGVGVFTDSYMWNKLPNLWNKGAFEMIDAFTEPFPIAAAASLLD